MIENRHRVRAFIFLLFIGLSIVALGIFALVSIFPRMNYLVKQDMLQQAADKLDMVFLLISQHYESYTHGLLDELTAQELTKKHLEGTFYGPEKLDYFWVLSKEGVLIAHPYLKDYIGKHYLEVDDEVFRTAVEKILQAAKEKRNYVEYDFYRYDRTQVENKISAIRIFEPWGWIVGTGFYRTTFLTKVREVQNNFILAVVLFFGLIISIYLVFLIQYTKANKEISRILKEISTERDRLRTLIEFMPQPVALFDQTQKLLEYNRAYSELLSYDPVKFQIQCVQNSQESREISLKTNSGMRWYNALCREIFDKDRNLEGSIQILTDITEQKLQVLFWQDKANQDPLTGVANRNVLEQLMDNFPELASEFSVIMIDIDGFKQVNDSYGHLVGDRVLVHFAETVKNSIRKDTFFVRYGGDEFLIIAPRSGKEAAKNLIERIRREFRTPLQINGIQITISFCAGISTFPADGEKLRDLIERADRALYAAKALGSNQTDY